MRDDIDEGFDFLVFLGEFFVGFRQRGFGALALGNVLIQFEYRLMGAIELQSPRASHRNQRTIAAVAQRFPLPVAFAEELRANVFQRLRELRFEQAMGHLAHDFLLTPAVEPLRAVVPVRDAVLAISDKNGLVGQIEDKRLVAQEFFGFFAIRDVNDGGQHKASFPAGDGTQSYLYWNFASVLTNAKEFASHAQGRAAGARKKPVRWPTCAPRRAAGNSISTGCPSSSWRS